MVTAIFEGITSAVSAFIGTLNSGIQAMTAIFWTAGEGGAAGSLTVVGTLTVIVVGVSLVYFLLRFIMGLVRLRG